MLTVFITGGSGFIGGHLIKRLCDCGYKVKALVRPKTCYYTLKGLPVEIIKGDLSSVPLIRESIKGCDLIFHAAADYRLWIQNPAEMYASNVDGTRHVLQAALDFGVKKVVYTSTVGTIALRDDNTPADESSFLQIDSKTGHYKKSKFLAEQVALDFAKRGLPVVIVNPSAPVGSQDWKPTPTGRMILDFLNRRMPMYLDTGLNLVDVEDVADGHLLAAQYGRIGERYILGNENLTFEQILLLLSEITGLPAPKIRCPYPAALAAAWFSETLARFSGGQQPRVPLEGVRMARKYMFFDSQKAIRELHYRPGPVRLALLKAVQWFLQEGYVKKSLPIDLPALNDSHRNTKMACLNENAIAIAK